MKEKRQRKRRLQNDDSYLWLLDLGFDSYWKNAGQYVINASWLASYGKLVCSFRQIVVHFLTLVSLTSFFQRLCGVHLLDNLGCPTRKSSDMVLVILLLCISLIKQLLVSIHHINSGLQFFWMLLKGSE